MIPGVIPAVRRMRERGLKIGTTTGYTRAMLDVLAKHAAAEGFQADCDLTPDAVGAGRPHPYMIYELAVRLKVYPLSAIVKVGDTPADIEEALNAGAWAVGVTRTGNMIGLTEAELNALPEAELQSRLAAARKQLENAGAHAVIDSVAEIDPVLDRIDERLNAR